MEEKFLPIGSIVLLKNGTKMVMITGYLPQSSTNPTDIFDYSGCLFPEGLLSSDQNVVFYHDQINQIIFKGYQNEESIGFLNEIRKIDNIRRNNYQFNSNMGMEVNSVEQQSIPQPMPQPAAQPVPQPMPQPIQQAMPQPVPQPMMQPMPQQMAQPVMQPMPQIQSNPFEDPMFSNNSQRPSFF